MLARGSGRGRRLRLTRRLRVQNQNFAANCTTRGSSADVIVPKLAGPTCAAGAPTLAVFSRLKTSYPQLELAPASDADATHQREIDIAVGRPPAPDCARRNRW